MTINNENLHIASISGLTGNKLLESKWQLARACAHIYTHDNNLSLKYNLGTLLGSTHPVSRISNLNTMCVCTGTVISGQNL